MILSEPTDLGMRDKCEENIDCVAESQPRKLPITAARAVIE